MKNGEICMGVIVGLEWEWDALAPGLSISRFLLVT